MTSDRPNPAKAERFFPSVPPWTRISEGRIRCPRIFSRLAPAVALGLMVGACGCKQEEQGPPSPQAEATSGKPAESGGPPSSLKPVNPNDSAKAQEQARMAVIMAMRRGEPPPPPAMKLRGGEPATPEVMQAYNQELLRVRVQERRSPENLDELVQKWIGRWRLLPRLPAPPPGKRIVYDEQNCIIRLDPP